MRNGAKGLVAGAAVLGWMAVSCRGESVGPGDARLQQPTFTVQAGGLDSIGCEQGVAWDYSAHFRPTSSATFILTAFTIRHTDTYTETQDTAFDNPDNVTDAYAHLWRHFDPPYVTDTTRLGSNQPKLIWQNRHLGRIVDSTEVYRSDNGTGFERVAALAQSASDFADTALARGVYSYFVTSCGM